MTNTVLLLLEINKSELTNEICYTVLTFTAIPNFF